ncbi:MAG: GxxExxY protein [Deltaproteobacteria bacterium]|nr:GxxExxY protein [Deltaproteobacteria bacterium]
MEPQNSQKITEKILIYEDESYAIRGDIFEVHKNMGSGFLEAVYQECLEKEFSLRNIPYVAQSELSISYKEFCLKQKYKPDFICFNKIIIEIKAVKDIAAEHKAQLINNLKATNFKLGLLVNFGSHPKVQIERFAL